MATSILIVMVAAYAVANDRPPSVALLSQEFTDKQSCQAAGAAVVQDFLAKNGRRISVTWRCSDKSKETK